MNLGPSRHEDRDHYDIDIAPRWADFDIYGHLNHAAYYALGDTAINEWMRVAGGLDARSAPVIGVVASSRCDFRCEIAYPGTVRVEVVVNQLGHTSITFDVVFRADSTEHSATVAAQGQWRHVYIDRQTRRATAIPVAIRQALDVAASTIAQQS